MEKGLIEYFNWHHNYDLRTLIQVYKMNETRNRRDDNLDSQNMLHNMMLTSNEKELALPFLQDEFFSELIIEIQRRGGFNLICNKKLLCIEIQNEVLNLDYTQVKIKWCSERKKQISPFKLTHLCAAVVVKNFDKYNLESMGQLQAMFSRSENLKKISFRAGAEGCRRAYSLTSILKNLIYPKIFLRTIQSDEYYDNIKINLKPYCSKCTDYEEHFNLFVTHSNNISYCTCHACNFLEHMFFTILFEPTGHYKFCDMC